MNSYKLILAVAMATGAVSQGSAADYACPEAQVETIQVQDNAILIQLVGQGYKKLGAPESMTTQAKLSLALTAQSTGRGLVLIFDDAQGADCTANQYGMVPTKVRIYRP